MCVCLSLHRQYMCTCVCIRRERDRYFKELSQRIVEVVKSKIYRVSWQSGDSRKKLLFQFKLEGTLLTDFPLLLGRPVFSADYMRPPVLCIQSALHAYVLSFQWYPTLCDLWTAACQSPLSMGFCSKNTGVGCCVLLMGIFLTQESKSHPLYIPALAQ